MTRKYKVLLFFSIGGLLGPLVWGIAKAFGVAMAIDYTVAMLWPTWGLGSFEYSVGQPLAGLIAVGANILVFLCVGAFSLIRPSGFWRIISFGCVSAALVWLNYWLNNWDIPSLLVAIAVVAMLYVLSAKPGSEHNSL